MNEPNAAFRPIACDKEISVNQQSPSEPYIDTRQIGNASVTIINEGAISWAPAFPVAESEWRAAMPDADEHGEVPLGINVALIQTKDATILIDPGMDDPSSAWQQEFARKWPGSTRSPGLATALAEIGVQPNQISHVLITHAHHDHLCGLTIERDGENVARFPSARHFIGRAEWEGNPARDQPGSELAIRLGPVERLGLLELVDEQREVAPGVTMFHAPGETPGHCAVRVDSAHQTLFYLGDLFHHPCEFEHVDWIPPDRDLASTRASRTRVLAEAASTNATLVFTHGRFPPWGRAVPTDDGFQWEPA
jgi:glyoxylase-like metal-dependent hydrolase (beta-lactamase superfamily II)